MTLSLLGWRTVPADPLLVALCLATYSAVVFALIWILARTWRRR